MSKVMRLSLDMEYPFQYKEDKEGNLVYHSDYAALEARVKELEGRVTAHIVDRKRSSEEKARLEAELARLKAQEPTLELRPFGEVTQGAFVKCEHNHPEAIKLYTEPRPEVLPQRLVVKLPDDLPDDGYSTAAMCNWARNEMKKKCTEAIRKAGGEIA